MNSTMKIVRSKIAERYAERIQYLYRPEGKNIVNEENVKALQ
jgi:long-chain acyl-CoA synthetase